MRTLEMDVHVRSARMIDVYVRSLIDSFSMCMFICAYVCACIYPHIYAYFYICIYLSSAYMYTQWHIHATVYVNIYIYFCLAHIFSFFLIPCCVHTLELDTDTDTQTHRHTSTHTLYTHSCPLDLQTFFS